MHFGDTLGSRARQDGTWCEQITLGDFSKRPSVAVNFYCKDMGVHNRKDIDFEGEGDRLLSLFNSTSSPFIILFEVNYTLLQF